MGWIKKHPIWTIVIVIVVLGIIGAASSDTSTTTQQSGNDTEKTANVEEQVPVEAMKVDGVEFLTEFDKNQLSAEDKYKGKLVELTAKIENISEDIGGSYFLSLKPEGYDQYSLNSIKCTFKDKSALTSLSNDQVVTVQGTVEGQTIGIVDIKDCKLVQ